MDVTETNTGNYFPQHPRPSVIFLRVGSVNVVSLNFEAVIKAEHFAKLLNDIDAESLVTVVSGHHVRRLFQHTVGVALEKHETVISSARPEGLTFNEC